MFYDFSHRHTPCTVDGTPDTVILSRDSKSTSFVTKEYLYNATFAPTSTAQGGSLLEVEGNTLIIQTMRPTTEKDRYCSAVKCNVQVEVQRYKQGYDGNDNEIGDSGFPAVQSDVFGFAQAVNARMRQEDLGILATTTHILYIQSIVDVKKPQEAKQPDRIVMNGLPYQVGAIDDLKLPNQYVIQLSEDVR
ncbi:hypothetical protein OB236_38340 [Paenibacillus sp. WQ 127069]|uniref:Head-tail adaptor protein n=1 Tax=Paenibacillus baimaensis TaxID=2982185 RepID=A0ABT2UTL7_9BACL|nr:hypothetical protein [Paenibacillus sp. WQ 127069]MCU6798001.1 hypothetical protein [Paenibacillus sp. WQ 127069]